MLVAACTTWPGPTIRGASFRVRDDADAIAGHTQRLLTPRAAPTSCDRVDSESRADIVNTGGSHNCRAGPAGGLCS